MNDREMLFLWRGECLQPENLFLNLREVYFQETTVFLSACHAVSVLVHTKSDGWG